MMNNFRSLFLAAFLLPATAVMLAASDDFLDEAAAVFERGLSVGVDAVDREYRVQGWKQEQVDVLDYMVVLDSKKISTKRLLLLKDFGFRRGLSPVELSGGMLLYKSFDNRPDAEELVRYLNGAELSGIPEKVYVYKKRQDEKFTKAPFAFKYIFDRMQREIKEDVQVVVLNPEQAKKLGVVKEVHIPVPATHPETKAKDEAPKPAAPKVEIIAPLVTPNPTPAVVGAVEKPVIKPVAKSASKPVVKKKTVIKAPSIQTKPFRLKSGSAEYFSYNASWGGSDALGSYNHKESGFKAKEVVKNKGQVYRSSGTVVTDAGVKYVKVAGKNMYFDAYNTSICE